MTDAQDPNPQDGESPPPDSAGNEQAAESAALSSDPSAETSDTPSDGETAEQSDGETAEPAAAPDTTDAVDDGAAHATDSTAADETTSDTNTDDGENATAADANAATTASDGGEPPKQDEPPAREPIDWALLSQALIALFAVGAGVAGCGYELTLGDALDALIDKNTLPNRRPLTLAILGGGTGMALVALIYALVGRLRRRTKHTVEQLHQLGRFLLPLSLTLLLPYMFRATTWHKAPAKMLMLMGALALILEPMLRASLAATPQGLTDALSHLSKRVPDRTSRWLPLILVMLGAIGYSVFASYYTILHHQRLSTACYDLGQYDNLFYNAMVGHPFRLPSLGAEQDWTSLKGHAELGMYVLLPFYTIKPRAETLLIIQATLLGTAAIPLYLFGTRLVSRWTSLVIALAYLLYAPLHRSNFYDFHMQPIAVVFILWMLFFLVSKRRWLFWIFFVLSLIMREDISIGLATLGVFLVITGYRPKTGAVMIAASVSYFVVLKFGIMPRMGKWWFANIYKDLQIKGSKGYGSIIETLLSNPAYVFRTVLTEKKVAYALHILMPLAFLPIRKRYLALAIVPGFFFTLLTTGYNPTVSVGFQYNAYYIPYVFPAALVALRVLGGKPANPDKEDADKEDADKDGSETPDLLGPALLLGNVRRRAALGTVAVMTLISSYQYGAILQHKTFRSGFSKVQFSITEAEKQRYRDMREAADQIPPGGTVAATEHLAPHVSARPTMYCFRHSISKADYIFVGPIDRTSGVRKTLTKLLNENKIGLVAEKGGFYVLRRGEDPSHNAEVLKNWGRSTKSIAKPKTKPKRNKPKKGKANPRQGRTPPKPKPKPVPLAPDPGRLSPSALPIDTSRPPELLPPGVPDR